MPSRRKRSGHPDRPQHTLGGGATALEKVLPQGYSWRETLIPEMYPEEVRNGGEGEVRAGHPSIPLS